MALAATIILGLLLMIPAATVKFPLMDAAGDESVSLRRLLRLLPMCAAIMLLMAWVFIVRSPWEDWNAARTAWAIAWARGAPLYYPPGAGPATDFMYGPIAAVVRLPAAWMTTPTAAVIIACAINAAIYFLPAMLFFWLVRADLLHALIAALVFAGFSLTIESLSYSAFSVHADAPAAGFAMLACGLVLNLDRGWKCWSRLMLAAVCVALSIGSKQNFASISLVLPIFAFVTRGRRAAAVLLFAETIALAALVLISIRAFGYEAVVYHTITVPARHPWLLPEFGKLGAMLVLSGQLIQDIAVPICILAFFIVFVPGVGGKTWLLPLAIAISMIPGALVARAKVGGDVNTLTASSYFLVVALATAIAQHRPRNDELSRIYSRRMIVGGGSLLCVMLAIGSITPWVKITKSYPMIADLPRNPQELVYNFARRHPQEAYFPWNPLPTLMSDGKYYPFDYGIVDLWLSHEMPDAPQMASLVPAKLKYIIFPPNSYETDDVLPFFFPEFKKRIQLPELKDWRVYVRDGEQDQ